MEEFPPLPTGVDHRSQLREMFPNVQVTYRLPSFVHKINLTVTASEALDPFVFNLSIDRFLWIEIQNLCTFSAA